MANKANRYALAELRDRLVKFQGYHPADVTHLVPHKQYRRPTTPFERNLIKGLQETAVANASLPGYRRFTANVKKVRRMLSRHFRNLARMHTDDREQYQRDLFAAHQCPGGAAAFINDVMNGLAAA